MAAMNVTESVKVVMYLNERLAREALRRWESCRRAGFSVVFFKKK